ncbi:Ger(x)C family spore germination protein [Paenibacillus lignilyticus]|uniref:Ger(X)C family spore germination protein n=1 Tax=Paenibacillus lignilyticus TaxID=1172615 RepID=A0ABS5CJ46_9BACL|nr:Ger(x)C family spore germination protein [Paenibacillus lignilyticus]MBP3965858.1 Ger(x)C family spore germination protein [Paenibacillus lignilyticus]
MKKGIAALMICLLLTGCWDQVQLKRQLFVDVVGVDYTQDSKKLNVSYIIATLKEANLGGGKPSGIYVSATGDSLYDAVTQTNHTMPGVLTVQETRLYLITPKFAKDQPLNYLNATGQFITNPLYAYLAVYNGDLSKLLSKKKIKQQTVPEYLVGLLDGQLNRGRIPSNKLLDYILGGEGFLNDFALNLFEPSGDEARLAGTALFREGKYTGVNLNNEDTLLACLMHEAKGKNQPLIGHIEGKVYTAFVQSVKHDLHVIHDETNIREIDISLKLDVKLVEDGFNDKKHTDKMLNDLEKAIAADLNSKASNVIATLQKANCDYLQISHELAAYHPILYKGMNFRAQYPKLIIKPNIKVKILNTGVLG